MEKQTTESKSSILRLLPSIDDLLGTEAARALLPEIGRKRFISLARNAADSVRREIQNGSVQNSGSSTTFSRESLLTETAARLGNAWLIERNSRLRRVINATGVIIHTNLGRAPLSKSAIKAIVEEASSYCTLEYDVETGTRGKRGARAENLLAELTGAESALIVNNCAAAAFLVLTVFASGREVIVSRGELVEIGGDFRIPDVLTQSGAILKEIGTTNRTKLSDYEKAISDNSGMILRVHPSNYKIVGFTETPNLTDLAELARQKGLLLYEDAGSGAMLDLNRFGLTDEPVITDSIAAGADIVSFSGDKLLGGTQAGLIVGREESVEKIRKHPMYRVLRVDKLTYAALEGTLDEYSRGTALTKIPVLKMLSVSKAELDERTRQFAQKLTDSSRVNSDLEFAVIDASSVVGGGSAPAVQPDTVNLALSHAKLSPVKLEQMLRNSEPPVIARILEDKVLIDLRTISENEEGELLDILRQLK